MSKNCIVAQSGGPTAAINASLAGVVAAARDFGIYDKIYGAIHGIQGVLKKHFLDLSDKDDAFIQKLARTPAMYLGSCRFKLPDMKDDVSMYEEIFSIFEEMNIGAFFYIGGNDSMDTVAKLSAYAASIGNDIRIIGVPKTIDNDLIMTDHTPGFGSAAKYIASSIREIAYDTYIYDLESVNIIEIMGRHAGWLTGAAALARKYVGDNPLLIYLPETDFDVEEFLQKVHAAFEKNCNVVVCVSEGIHDKDGTFICEYDSAAGTDAFGHKMLAGCGKYLENLVRSRLGVKARSVELNVSQRCSAAMLSGTDQQEGILAGEFGVQAALNGETGKMIAFKRQSDSPYSMKCTLEDVNVICNEEKTVPVEWITEDGSDVTEDFIRYARPLIQAELTPLYIAGLPHHIYLKKQK